MYPSLFYRIGEYLERQRQLKDKEVKNKEPEDKGAKNRYVESRDIFSKHCILLNLYSNEL